MSLKQFYDSTVGQFLNKSKPSGQPGGGSGGSSGGEFKVEQFPFNNAPHDVTIYLDNGTQQLGLNPQAIVYLNIDDSLSKWWVTGELVIEYSYEHVENGSKHSGDLKEYIFRNDGFDFLKINIKPTDPVQYGPPDKSLSGPDGFHYADLPQHLLELNLWLSIYNIEDLETPVDGDMLKTIVRYKKFYFRDYRQQKMQNTIAEYSTALSPETAGIPSTSPDEARALLTGKILREIIKKIEVDDNLKRTALDIPSPKPEEWDTGGTAIFVTAGSTQNMSELVEYVLDKHIATQGTTYPTSGGNTVILNANSTGSVAAAGAAAGAPSTPAPTGEAPRITGAAPFSGSQQEFYKKIYDGVYAGAVARGMPNPEVVAQLGAAQSCLETGYGKHMPPGSNNAFGIKGKGNTTSGVSGAAAGSVTAMTSETFNGKTVRIQQNFKQYNDVGDGGADYARIIGTGSSYGGIRSATNINDALAGLGKSQYATSPEYAQQVAKIASKATASGWTGGQHDTPAKDPNAPPADPNAPAAAPAAATAQASTAAPANSPIAGGAGGEKPVIPTSTTIHDICILTLNRGPQVGEFGYFALQPLNKFFEGAGKSGESPGVLQYEHFYLQTPVGNTNAAQAAFLAPIKNKAAKEGTSASEIKDLSIGGRVTIKNYKFVDVSAEFNAQSFKTRAVCSFDMKERNFSIDFESNTVELAKKFMAEHYIDNVYSGQGEKEEKFLININKDKKNKKNIDYVMSLYGGNQKQQLVDGIHHLLYNGVFQNACINFDILGQTFREPGVFIGIDRPAGSDITSTFDTRFCGQWFVIKVLHRFTRAAYFNNITAIRIHRHTPLSLQFQDF